jgi:hypothetical protein
MQNVSETGRSPVAFGTWFSCLYKGLFKNGYPNLSNDQWNHGESGFHGFQTLAFHGHFYGV